MSGKKPVVIPSSPSSLLTAPHHSDVANKVTEEGVAKIKKADSENDPPVEKQPYRPKMASIPRDRTDDTEKGDVKAASVRTATDDNYDDPNTLLESFRNKNFAEKLHALLSVPAYSSIVRWNSSGNAFAIYETAEFVNTIMPAHFQRSKFDSFTRRMRRWGFRRIESMEEKMKGLVIFRCKSFLRDKPELCKMMCDDRQLKNKERTNHNDSLRGVVPDMHSSSLNRHQVKRFDTLVPVHYPSSHPDQSGHHWTLPRQLPAPVFPPMDMTLAMKLNQAMNQPFAMGAMHYPQHQPYPSLDMHMQGINNMPMMHHSAMPGLPLPHNMNMMLPDPQHAVAALNNMPPTGQCLGEQAQNQYIHNQILVHEGNEAKVALQSRLLELEQKKDDSEKQGSGY